MSNPDHPSFKPSESNGAVKHPIIIAGCLAAALAFANPSLASDMAWGVVSFFAPSN